MAERIKPISSADPPGPRVYTAHDPQSMTKQSFREQVNINFIIRKYDKTGVISHLNRRTPTFGDFSNVTSYQEALEQVEAAQSAFMDLPHEVRTWAMNDPGRLIELVNDESNAEQMAELGLGALFEATHGYAPPDPKKVESEVPTASPSEPSGAPEGAPPESTGA